MRDYLLPVLQTNPTQRMAAREARPSLRLRFSLLLLLVCCSELTQGGLAMSSECHNAAKLQAQFIQILRSRRSPDGPLKVEPTKPVTIQCIRRIPPTFSEAMESCPKADIKNLKDLLVEESLYLHTKASERAKLPILILSMKESSRAKRLAVVFVHSTHKCKEWLQPLLEAYASRGYAVAIDSRYHGECASSLTTYQDVSSLTVHLYHHGKRATLYHSYLIRQELYHINVRIPDC